MAVAVAVAPAVVAAAVAHLDHLVGGLDAPLSAAAGMAWALKVMNVNTAAIAANKAS